MKSLGLPVGREVYGEIPCSSLTRVGDGTICGNVEFRKCSGLREEIILPSLDPDSATS